MTDAKIALYPITHDSGEQWLGGVPQHWDLRRIKTVLVERSEKGLPNEPLLAATQIQGVVRKEKYGVRTVLALMDLQLLKVVRPGDFVVSLRSFQGGIEYARDQGIISPAYTILYPKERAHHAYLSYLFKSRPFIDNLTMFVTGIREGQSLDYEKLSRSYLPLPPLSEQRIIVRYLGHVDELVRGYIRNKLQLIKLIEEFHERIITQAVTGAIDILTGRPYGSYRLASADWIGRIPEHWELRRVKQVSQILRGRFAHRPRNDPSLYGGAYPFVQTGDVARAEGVIKTYHQTLNERGLAASRTFPAGTLVMAVAANIGDVAVLKFEACFPDSVVGFVPRQDVKRDYLYYIFRSMRGDLLRDAPVSTQGNLNVERIGRKIIPCPSIPEQRRIVQELERQTTAVRVNLYSSNSASNCATQRISRTFDRRRR